MSRSAVAQLASSLPADTNDQVVRSALDERGPEAATALGFALALRGAKLDDDILVALLRETESQNIVPLLLHLSSDVAQTTVELLENGSLSHERECLALCAATRALALSKRPAPQSLVARTRTLIRLSPLGCATYLRITAESLGEAELAATTPWAPARFVKRIRAEVDQAYHDLTASLPEYAPPPVLRGFTVRHVTAKVGRNDPCPCNSGAKYKKCCGASGKSAELNPIGLTAQHLAPGNSSLISDDQFRLMRPHELAQLEPNELTALRLGMGIRALSHFHRWQLAEEWTSVLTAREGSDPGWWEELGHDALAAGELELARRCLAKLGSDGSEYLSLKLATGDGSPLLEQWEAVIREDLDTGFANHQYTLAFALLEKYPALGIFVARGCLSAERAFDSEMLLQAVDEARDKLGLDSVEPFWAVFETMLEADEVRATDERLSEAQQARIVALQAKVEQSRTEVAVLKRELLTQQQLLRGSESQRQELTPEQPSHESDAEHQQKLETAEHERQRLQSRVRELRARLKEEVNERHALRDSLKQLRAEDAKPTSEAARPENADQAGVEQEESLVLDTVVPLRRPTVTERQLEELKGLEGDLGRKALHCLGDLCGGAPNAWHQVKRLKRSRGTFSVRLGIHHRLLFTCTPNELQFEAVIPRKDLDRYVDGLSRR